MIVIHDWYQLEAIDGPALRCYNEACMPLFHQQICAFCDEPATDHAAEGKCLYTPTVFGVLYKYTEPDVVTYCRFIKGPP